LSNNRPISVLLMVDGGPWLKAKNQPSTIADIWQHCAIGLWNVNKSLLFNDTLFSTKCCWTAAIVVRYNTATQGIWTTLICPKSTSILMEYFSYFQLLYVIGVVPGKETSSAVVANKYGIAPRNTRYLNWLCV
jgi:hypothetical protein